MELDNVVINCRAVNVKYVLESVEKLPDSPFDSSTVMVASTINGDICSLYPHSSISRYEGLVSIPEGAKNSNVEEKKVLTQNKADPKVYNIIFFSYDTLYNVFRSRLDFFDFYEIEPRDGVGSASKEESE